MADGDIVIIGIGHCRTKNGASAKINNASLLAKSKSEGITPSTSTSIEEWHYNSILAKKIKDKLSSKNIEGVLSNREDGAEISGGGYGPMAEVNAMNNFIKRKTEEGKVVRCAINLHLNAATGTATGYEYLIKQNSDLQSKLGKCITKHALSALGGIKYRGEKFFNGRGDAYGKAVRVPCIILESFFVDNPNDHSRGIENIDELAEAIAQGIKDYCDGNYQSITMEEAKAMEVVKSSALASSSIEPKFNNDQIKEAALNSQKNLNTIERSLGEGGNKYSFYTKNAIETVGTMPIPFTSSLVDETGNAAKTMMLRDGGICRPYRLYPKYQAIDYTSNVPTGHKQIIVHSRFTVKSYEIDLNSSGWTRINAGENLRLASSQQVDLISGNNINLEAGQVTTITANDIFLAGTTSVSGNLMVDGSGMFSGPTYFAGGISAPSFNGPRVIDKTNQQQLYGYLVGDVEMSLADSDDAMLNCEGQIEIDGEVKNCKLSIKTTGKIKVTHIKGDAGEPDAPGGNPRATGNAMVIIPSHLHYFNRLAGSLDDNIVQTQRRIQSSINN